MPQSAQLPACCYELHKQISGGVGCTGGRGPVIGPAEGAWWRLDLLYAPRRRLKLGRFGKCRCYNDVFPIDFFYRFSAKHVALPVVTILTVLLVFGVTLTANSDHFSKQHSRLLTEPTGAYCGLGCALNFCYLKFVFERPRRGPGSQSSASLRRSTGLIPDQSTRVLWWTKWHWDKLLFCYWVFTLPLLFHLPSIFVGIFKAVLSIRTNGRSLVTLTPFRMSRNVEERSSSRCPPFYVFHRPAQPCTCWSHERLRFVRLCGLWAAQTAWLLTFSSPWQR